MSLDKPADWANTSAAQQGNHAGRQASQFLCQQLKECQVAVGKHSHYSLLLTRKRSLVQYLQGHQPCQLGQHLFTRFALGFGLVESFSRLLRNLPDVRGIDGGGLGQSSVISAGRGQRPLPADELDADALLHLFRFAQQDAPDLTGVADMGTAAGGQVKILNVNQAQFATFSGRNFAQPQIACFLLGNETHHHNAAVADHRVRPPLGCFHLILRNRFGSQVDAAAFLSHVE
jgi:hypothetical protein